MRQDDDGQRVLESLLPTRASARSRPRPRPRRTPCSKRVGSRDPARSRLAGRASPPAPSHEQIPRKNETRSSRTRAPSRRGASRAPAVGVLPVGPATRVTTRVVAAETRRVRRARLRHLRRRGGDPLAAPNARGPAHGQSRGPRSASTTKRTKQDPESSPSPRPSPSSSGARAAPAATASPDDARPRPRRRGPRRAPVRRPDRPSRRVKAVPPDPLRRLSWVEPEVRQFFATKRTERPAKRKRGRPRKNEEREK